MFFFEEHTCSTFFQIWQKCPNLADFSNFARFLKILFPECHDLQFEHGCTSSFAITEEKDTVMCFFWGNVFDFFPTLGTNAPIWPIFRILLILLIFLFPECHDLQFEHGNTSSFAITEEKDSVMWKVAFSGFYISGQAVNKITSDIQRLQRYVVKHPNYFRKHMF